MFVTDAIEFAYSEDDWNDLLKREEQYPSTSYED